MPFVQFPLFSNIFWLHGPIHTGSILHLRHSSCSNVATDNLLEIKSMSISNVPSSFNSPYLVLSERVLPLHLCYVTITINSSSAVRGCDFLDIPGLNVLSACLSAYCRPLCLGAVSNASDNGGSQSAHLHNRINIETNGLHEQKTITQHSMWHQCSSLQLQ